MLLSVVFFLPLWIEGILFLRKSLVLKARLSHSGLCRLSCGCRADRLSWWSLLFTSSSPHNCRHPVVKPSEQQLPFHYGLLQWKTHPNPAHPKLPIGFMNPCKTLTNQDYNFKQLSDHAFCCNQAAFLWIEYHTFFLFQPFFYFTSSLQWCASLRTFYLKFECRLSFPTMLSNHLKWCKRTQTMIGTLQKKPCRASLFRNTRKGTRSTDTTNAVFCYWLTKTSVTFSGFIFF